jgi:hypothetical protein
MLSALMVFVHLEFTYGVLHVLDDGVPYTAIPAAPPRADTR